MQYIGHLDLHRSWERSFRRAGLPLAYSLGFHPQPRLNLACALPLGFTSSCELLDAWLESDLPLDKIQLALSASLPPGLTILALALIDQRTPALQTQTESAIYTVTFLDEIPDLAERMDKLLSATQVPRQRRDKPYDLRPLIEHMELVQRTADNLQRLSVQLSVRQAATGRPEELLDEMGIKFENTRVHREKLILRA